MVWVWLLLIVEGACEERHQLVHLNLGLSVHVDSRRDDHLNEFEAVCLSGADGLVEPWIEPVEGNVLSITVVLAAFSHTF